MAFDHSQPRKILPVDILEADGLYTRGYVQDLLDDGDCVVYFDCQVNPLRTVNPAQVFKLLDPNSSSWRRRRFLDDSSESSDTDSGSSVELPRVKSDVSRRHKVEVLIRWSPGAAKRWYTGVETRVGAETVVDIENAPGGPCRTILNRESSSRTIQAAGTREREEFCKIPISIPGSMKSEVGTAEFVTDWEKETKVLVKSMDSERGVMTVLVNESNPMSPMGYLKKVTAGLRAKSAAAGQKRTVDLEMDDAVETKKSKWKHGARKDDQPETAEVEDGIKSTAGSCTALEIPELLSKVLRYVGLTDRHALRGVSTMWKSLLESAVVCSTLSLDESAYVMAPFAEQETSFVDRFRYFTRPYHENLTSVCIQCSVDPESTGVAGTFLDILSRIGTFLAPRLKFVVITGKFDCEDLVQCLRVEKPLQLRLRDVTLYCLDCFGHELQDMHVWIKSADWNPPEFPSTSAQWDDEAPKKARTFLPPGRTAKQFDWMRSFLCDALDQLTLPVEEEKTILEKVAAALDRSHQALASVLYYADRKFFNPAMLSDRHRRYSDDEDEHNPQPSQKVMKIRVAPSMLRNATVHLFRAILLHAEHEDYRCGDPHCSRKHGFRSRSLSAELED